MCRARPSHSLCAAYRALTLRPILTGPLPPHTYACLPIYRAIDQDDCLALVHVFETLADLGAQVDVQVSTCAYVC